MKIEELIAELLQVPPEADVIVTVRSSDNKKFISDNEIVGVERDTHSPLYLIVALEEEN